MEVLCIYLNYPTTKWEQNYQQLAPEVNSHVCSTLGNTWSQTLSANLSSIEQEKEIQIFGRQNTHIDKSIIIRQAISPNYD